MAGIFAARPGLAGHASQKRADIAAQREARTWRTCPYRGRHRNYCIQRGLGDRRACVRVLVGDQDHREVVNP